MCASYASELSAAAAAHGHDNPGEIINELDELKCNRFNAAYLASYDPIFRRAARTEWQINAQYKY